MPWWKLAPADVDEGSTCLSRGVSLGGPGPPAQGPHLALSWCHSSWAPGKGKLSISPPAPTPLRSIHAKLIFVYGIRWGSRFSLFYLNIQFFQHHLLKVFLYWMILVLLSKINWLWKYGFTSGISIVFHWWVYSYTDPTLYWLLYLFSKSWNQVVWVF